MGIPAGGLMFYLSLQGVLWIQAKYQSGEVDGEGRERNLLGRCSGAWLEAWVGLQRRGRGVPVVIQQGKPGSLEPGMAGREQYRMRWMGSRRDRGTEAKRALFFASLFWGILFVSLFWSLTVSASGAKGYSVAVKIPVTYTAENTQESLNCKLEYEENSAQAVEDDTLTLKNGEEGFFELVYTEPGVYHCEVSQIKGESAGVTYDERIFMVDVYITDDGMGNLMAEAVVVYTEDSDEKLPSVDFTNKGESSPEPQSENTPTPKPSVSVTPTLSPEVTPRKDSPLEPSVTPEPPVSVTPGVSGTVTPTLSPEVTPREDPYVEPTVTPGPSVFVTGTVTQQPYPSDASVTPADYSDGTKPVQTADGTPSAEPFVVLMLVSGFVVLMFGIVRKRRG